MYGNVSYPGGNTNVFTKTPKPQASMDPNSQLAALLQPPGGLRMAGMPGPGKQRSAPRPKLGNQMVNLHRGPDPLAQLQKSAQIAQLQALTSPPPMRMVSGPGIVPGYMPDVNAMSGIQRQTFLPQGSSIEAPPDRSAAANAMKQEAEDDDFERFAKRTGGQRIKDNTGMVFGQGGRIG